MLEVLLPFRQLARDLVWVDPGVRHVSTSSATVCKGTNTGVRRSESRRPPHHMKLLGKLISPSFRKWRRVWPLPEAMAPAVNKTCGCSWSSWHARHSFVRIWRMSSIRLSCRSWRRLLGTL